MNSCVKPNFLADQYQSIFFFFVCLFIWSIHHSFQSVLSGSQIKVTKPTVKDLTITIERPLMADRNGTARHMGPCLASYWRLYIRVIVFIPLSSLNRETFFVNHPLSYYLPVSHDGPLDWQVDIMSLAYLCWAC